jgi:hypothetical protein
MKEVFVRRGVTSGMMGSVFHLRRECAEASDSVVYDLNADGVKHFRKVFGIRKICMKCRQALRRKA